MDLWVPVNACEQMGHWDLFIFLLLGHSEHFEDKRFIGNLGHSEHL